MCQTLCLVARYTQYLRSFMKVTFVRDYPHFTDDNPESQRGEVIFPRSHCQPCFFYNVEDCSIDTRCSSLFLGLKGITRLSSYSLITEAAMNPIKEI